jgi:1-acyl-sn-glycerol-3-phosphate acyltransferase
LNRWPFRPPITWLREVVARLLSVPVGWFMGGPQIRGAEHLSELRPPFMICPNHASHLDHPALRIALGSRYRRRLAIAAASDYFWRNRRRAFFAGWLGGFPFSRRSHGGGESLERIERLLTDGWNVLIYPEGTRSRNGEMSSFKPGAAFVASRTGCDVLPVRIVGTRDVLAPGQRWPHRARVEVRFGQPLRAAAGEDARRLNARLEAAVRAL